LQAQSTAKLDGIQGTVVVVRADGTVVQRAPSGTVIGPGDRLATVGSASAIVTIEGVGQVELGAATTVIFHQIGTEGVSIEVVSGITVHRLTANGFVGPYRVVDPGENGTLEARGPSTFGVARDENDNFTVGCDRCPDGIVTFPGTKNPLSSGEAVTLTARGDVISDKLGGNLFNALASGATADSDGSKTADGKRLPAGQRTGSSDSRRESPEDDVANTIQPTSTPTPTPTPQVVPRSFPVLEARIAGFAFSPNPIVVEAGQTIRWTNFDFPAHTVTADNGSFGSPLFGQNGTFSLTLTQPGIYTYFCVPHPGMKGAIDVR
jgi:plastocyanin